MAQPNLHNVDLNLLVPLHALLTERSVTKAAERLSTGQATVSISLAKLRRILGDPLLTRDGRQMILTPLAESLVDSLDEVLTQIRSLLSSTAVFDPATSRRTFTVVCSDYVLLVLIGPLLHELETVAPDVRVNAIPQQAGHFDLLHRAQCDLVLWPASITPAERSVFPSTVLLTDEFVAVVAQDHPDVGDRLSIEQLSTLPCVQVMCPTLTPLESHFGEHDLPRNVVATMETFTSAAHMLPDTHMYTVMQRRLFDRFGVKIGLRAVDLDVPMPTVTESMYWHPRVTGDPAHRWLRTTLVRLAAHLGLPAVAREPAEPARGPY